MADRISTLDEGYQTGDLSIYPSAIDNKDTLYEAKNDAQTVLTKVLTQTGKFIVVNDTSTFPDNGLIRIGNELIYYGQKGVGIFKDLDRGFGGSTQRQWAIGTSVSHTVDAEHHNSTKDALLNIEAFLGTSVDPTDESLNGILTALEKKHYAPKPTFRAFPLAGPPPLKVRFQNFTNRLAARFLWDFGDGGTSTEESPIHTYLSEGLFTVQLRLITQLGGQGVVVKSDYVLVNQDQKPPFMVVTPEMGTTSTVFTFIDQTDGDIIQRNWIFDDGTRVTIDDPDIHTVTHTYTTAGEYNPILMPVFADTTLKIVKLNDPIVVTT